MFGRLALLLGGLTLVALTCCSCSPSTSSTSGGAVAAPDPAQMKQQGAGGIKSRSGGGVAGLPEDAKPGEKVGPPPSGGKATGG